MIECRNSVALLRGILDDEPRAFQRTVLMPAGKKIAAKHVAAITPVSAIRGAAGGIMSERRATSSRNAWATSSGSNAIGCVASPLAQSPQRPDAGNFGCQLCGTIAVVLLHENLLIV